jgi:pimeloyl-ACP methyl ester carboxylesterase
MPTSSADFDELLGLTGGFAPDLPGFGLSVKAGHLGYTIDSHATFVERFLEELEIDRIKLVAHDWGAGGGLVYAQRHPERIERLVLIDALPLFGGFRWPRRVAAMRIAGVGELMMGAITRRVFTRILRRAAVTREVWSEQRLATAWEQFDLGTQRAMLRMIRDAHERRLEQAGLHLGRIEAPALIVWGEHDPWWPASLGERYASRLPYARLQIAAGSGHWPWLGETDLAAEIAAFLAAA